MNFEEIGEILGYYFANQDLLCRALTHSSYANEKGMDRNANNERLEFLGDAVLEMAISQILYRQTPSLTEGEMTRLRAHLVCEESLCSKAQALDLGAHILLGRGEDNGGGRERPSILADAFEAVIAAIFLDGGLEPAMSFIERLFGSQIMTPSKEGIDYKTRIQEIIQNKTGVTLKYKVIDERGPDHDKTFTAQILIAGKPKGTGTGKSKKLAEQAAAAAALKIIRGE